MIPLPRAWVLTSALLVGTAVGLLAATASSVLVHAQIRGEAVIAAVVGLPSLAGLLLILLARRRLLTALGAFFLALAPGWFGLLVAIQVVSGG